MSLMGLCVNTMFFVGVCMSFVICLCLLWVEKCERPECGEIVVYCEVFVCLFARYQPLTLRTMSWWGVRWCEGTRALCCVVLLCCCVVLCCCSVA